MDEASKTKALWGPLEHQILQGNGIDIGCGPDPILPNVRRFDVEDGDANCITQYVHEQFDFVFSSHCLEHMFDPQKTILEWWQLVKPGGHLVFIVPDEDLYEQGRFPSTFNIDHKATFTLSKHRSWSPVSHNVLDLANSLPKGKLIKLELQDIGYDRRLLTFGSPHVTNPIMWLVLRVYRCIRRRVFNYKYRLQMFEKREPLYFRCDQTVGKAMAQIQCIVQKQA